MKMGELKAAIVQMARDELRKVENRQLIE